MYSDDTHIYCSVEQSNPSTSVDIGKNYSHSICSDWSEFFKMEFFILPSCYARNQLHPTLLLTDGTNLEPNSTNLGFVVDSKNVDAQVTATCRPRNG